MSKLQTRVFYGLRTDVAGNAHFVTDDEVLYLVGNALSVHNFSQRRQRLIRLPDKHKINSMTITPNKKFAALCETGEKPLISIYDLHTLKRKKLLGIPYDASGVTSFSCLAFTFDSKYLAVVTNENQTMLFYNWEKGKLESSMELGNLQNPNTKVNLISCNPGDTGIIALGGKFAFKFLTVSETMWRPYGFSKAENLIITSLAWLNTDRLLAGTSDGRILFLENGDLKNIFKMTEVTLINLKIREEVAVANPVSQTSLNESREHRQEILCLNVFSRGFAFALGYGTIAVFEKDGQHKYTKRNVYAIPAQVSREESDHLYHVNTISSNPSSDKLIITTGWSQLFCATLWGPDLKVDPEPQMVDVIGHHLHHGPIGGLSICTWKSHLVTFGELDRSVRMWDYETESLIMVKQYLEDISCIVLHPTGLFCLIGFSDKLRFMSILFDDFLTMKEFSIRNCKIAAFSYGGQMFAAVNGNIIQVYATIDFNTRFLLKGHTEIIRGITWSQDDARLVSIGSEGAVYEWDMNTGLRSAEVVLKGMTLNGIVLSADGVTAYCISSDNRIHEIKENTVIRAYNMPGIQPSSIVMGKDDSLMFLTYPGGFVASLKYPLTDPVEFNEYHIHCSNISQMVLTYDEQVLITTGVDGTLCFWKVSYVDGKTSALRRDLLYSDQILISRNDLGDKVHAIRDLNTRIKELETEHVYKMRQTTLQHNDKLREIHQSYCEAIEELRDKIDKLEEDHTNEINTINVEIARTKAAHEEAMRQMEIGYDSKLIVEYDKYQAFEERNNAMREDYEQRLTDLAKASKAELEETIGKYEARLREKDLQLKEAHEEMAQEVRIHEIIKAQIEDDADREIVELRTNYEAALCEERALVLKLKGEAGVLRNKHAMSQKDAEDLKWQLNSLRDEYTQLKGRKEELEKDVVDLKSELQDRDSTILDKEKTIDELGLANQELEKFKFVLNHRITELQAQIEPRDKQINELKDKIADMELELLGLNKTNQNLELKLYELREKLSAAKREIQIETQRRKRCQQVSRKIRIELLDTAALIQEPNALKSAIIKLYHRYSDSEEFLRNHKADLDAQCEFMKQRDHLEKTISLLKKQIAQNNSGYLDVQLDKILEENITLLTELNALREELKAAQRHIADMESLLGLKGRDTGPMEARAKLAKACHGNEELEQNYKEQIQECQRIINVLKEDIDRLISRLTEKSTKKPEQ
ncbi:cilia- and flagella-associated protein 57 [Nasonia vitripennis]|uniref:WD repeat-containing protein 65 n=1 Tax=Nasonia vitripennis TaxID=7425 RepID=A0A7M7IR64_NASVI|nr:cilia- and flagella-associated protein 57 [Nasonia vitripennis]XP_031785639.1 cilia- and flagella-associated protein 57 [Nasonia vitripennis]